MNRRLLIDRKMGIETVLQCCMYFVVQFCKNDLLLEKDKKEEIYMLIEPKRDFIDSSPTCLFLSRKIK